MRIIRFVGEDKNGHYGCEVEPGVAEIYEGDPFLGLTATGKRTGIIMLLSPIDPVAVLCIGQNYAAHAAEMGAALPEHPVLFMKNPSAVTYSDTKIVLPDCCMDPPEVDYEGELVIVIGKPVKNVSEEDALDYVLGYTIANDVSARTWQKKRGGGQFCRGKSFDHFCPLGPALVTADEIPDPQALHIQTTLNGEVMQSSGTDDMIFSVASLISHLSDGMTLLHGTVILTGTPSGVGFARDPQVFLKPGDTVNITIDPIGTLSNTFAAAS